MGRNWFIVVSDDQNLIEMAKDFGHDHGMEVKAYTTVEWQRATEDPGFVSQFGGSVPSLSAGTAVAQDGAKILQFPNRVGVSETVAGRRVKTINELESLAIQNAITEFNGNLTEAAKALGIGRATLYRKVKQYSIDPSLARKKRAA